MKFNFELMNAENQICGTVIVKDGVLTATHASGVVQSFPNVEISSIELLEADMMSAGQTAGGVVFGALLFGPLGAAAGAGIGRLLRKCRFILTFKDGTTVPCRAIFKVYETFNTMMRIAGIPQSDSGTPAAPSIEKK